MSSAGQLHAFIVERINSGILVVDRDYTIVLWNRFMEAGSGCSASDVVWHNLFERFPELPRAWLTKKLESVFILGNYAFTNWQSRPYLFKLRPNRPITGGADFMRQSCTFLPVRGAGGSVEYVCIAVHDVTESAIYEARLREAMRKVEFVSAHDALTGVANRRTLEERLQKEVARAVRHDEALSLVMLDIDSFKGINDTHGHLCGDEVLRALVARLRSVIRGSDVAARFGGDEFVVILPETTAQGASILAERLRKAVTGEPVVFENRTISISVSIGITELRRPAQSGGELLDEADKALYECKLAGRDCVRCFNPRTP